MGVDVTLDTGAIYACRSLAITETSTLQSLSDELSKLGAELLVDTLAAGLREPQAQVGEPTYAHKLSAEDFVLDWNSPARDLQRVIRVGGARTTFRDKLLKIHEAGLAEGPQLAPGEISETLVGTGDGLLELVTVQPEGKPRMAVAAWLNGAHIESADRLGS